MTDEDKAFWLSWCIEEYASEKTSHRLKSQKCLKKKMFFPIWTTMLKFCTHKEKTTS